MTANETSAPASEEPLAAPEEALPDKDFVPSVFDYFDTDKTAEEQGKWFHDIRLGMNFKMRRLSSKAAQEIYQKAQLRYSRRARNWKGEFSADDNYKIMLETMAYGVITDWSGKAMRGRDDKPIPFTADAAFQLLSKVPHLFEELLHIASKLDSFRVEDQKALEGNS